MRKSQILTAAVLAIIAGVVLVIIILLFSRDDAAPAELVPDQSVSHSGATTTVPDAEGVGQGGAEIVSAPDHLSPGPGDVWSDRTGYSADEIIVSDDDSLALFLPEVMLPAGLSQSSIAIRSLREDDERVISLDGDFLAAYEFGPAGTEFLSPVPFEVSLPVTDEDEGAFVWAVHAESDGSSHEVSPVQTDVNLENGCMTLRGELSHFSFVAFRRGFVRFEVVTSSAVGTPLGADIRATVIVTISDRKGADGSKQPGAWDSIWGLKGSITTIEEGVVEPEYRASLPPYTGRIAVDHFTVDASFKCRSAGTTHLTYEFTVTRTHTDRNGENKSIDIFSRVTSRKLRCIEQKWVVEVVEAECPEPVRLPGNRWYTSNCSWQLERSFEFVPGWTQREPVACGSGNLRPPFTQMLLSGGSVERALVEIKVLAAGSESHYALGLQQPSTYGVMGCREDRLYYTLRLDPGETARLSIVGVNPDYFKYAGDGDEILVTAASD